MGITSIAPRAVEFQKRQQKQLKEKYGPIDIQHGRRSTNDDRTINKLHAVESPESISK